MKHVILAALAAVSVVATAAAAAQGTTINLKAHNNSGESGTVTLTPQADKTQILIRLTGAPAGVAQPAHIHDGSCAKLDPKPRIPLENVTNGNSATLLGFKLDELMKQGGAINVHKSADDLQTTVACADLKAGG